MAVLIHPTYFPTVAHFVAIAKSNAVVFEVADNFVKQTYRNRAYIYGANGLLQLNVPVVYSQKNRKPYAEVTVFKGEKWQLQHWKSLESAYKTSPFFEFYEDELKPLFFEQVEGLLDFNLKCFGVICDCLQLDVSTSKTTIYEKTSSTATDFRCLVDAKKNTDFNLQAYTQVFSAKHGFIPNLSILDLLFNEGPNALNYLEAQHLQPC